MDEVRLGSRTLQPHRQLLACGARVPLGKRALDIVSVLAQARGEIVTKDELLEAVWPGVVVEENALQVHVAALRKALGPEADRLKTIRAVGYQLDIDPDQAPADSGPPLDKAQTGTVLASGVPAAAAAPSTALAPETARGMESPRAATRLRRLALAVIAFVALLAGAWAIFGSELGLRPQGRIPVVVRALSATGPASQTEAALASGVTDELIFRLRRIPDLRIATAEPDGSAPSAAFSNAYVVDGNISSSGDRLRVNVKLADANGEILWSDTLDRGIADLFDMQEEIAAAIAGALSVSFEVGTDSARYGGTDNPEAHAAYMQFWAHILDFDQSVPLRYLERAIALDPDFGKALGGLVVNYGSRVANAPSREQADELHARMGEASARALATNPDLWFGHAARGWYFLSRRDLQAAEREMRRAAELDPGDDPEFRTSRAIYFRHLGRRDKATAIQQSKELIDPIYRNDPWNVFDLIAVGEYEQATKLFDRLERNQARNLQAFSFHAYLAYLLAGREDDAERFANKRGYDFADRLRDQRAAALPAMTRHELRRWADGIANQQGQSGLVVAALLAGSLGDDRVAIDLMRMAYERPGGFVLLLLWHPAMAEARRTDAFEQLVIDLGFVKVWRESGDWGDFCRPVSAREIDCV